MGFATHLGPWLLGTVKNTTGTTAGTIRNMGATIVAQTYTAPASVILASPTAQQMFVLPAGAKIVRFGLEVNVALTGATNCGVTIGSAATANLYWASTDVTSQGRLAYTNAAAKLVNWCGAATTASPNGAGIGSTYVKVIATMTPTTSAVTAGTVQYTVMYVVANSSGAQLPSSSQN